MLVPFDIVVDKVMRTALLIQLKHIGGAFDAIDLGGLFYYGE